MSKSAIHARSRGGSSRLAVINIEAALRGQAYPWDEPSAAVMVFATISHLRHTFIDTRCHSSLKLE